MKDNLILIVKGFILGIANIIPGVSGGTLAITLGIYEKLISVISHFFHNLKDNFKFILFLGIGVIISLLVFSNLIGFCLDNYPFATTLFFIGIIFGGIPQLFIKIKGKRKPINYLVLLLSFLFVLSLPYLTGNNNVISLNNIDFFTAICLFLSGFIASISMMLPGISGSFVLVLLGYYEPIINTIRSLTKMENILHDMIILFFVGIGILLGIIVAAKIIEWLLNKYEVITYYGIIGFVFASIISIFLGVTNNAVSLYEIIFGVFLFLIGLVLSKFIGEK